MARRPARGPVRGRLRTGRNDDRERPVWRSAPALVAYALVGLVLAGAIFLQVSYNAPDAASGASPAAGATVTVAPPPPEDDEAAQVPPVETDDGLSPTQSGQDAAAASVPEPGDPEGLAEAPAEAADAGAAPEEASAAPQPSSVAGASADEDVAPAPAAPAPEPASQPVTSAAEPAPATAAAGPQPGAAAPPAPSPEPELPRQLALAPAPDPALQTDGPFGPLPAVAEDGRKAWQVYARPFPSARTRPRIAIVIQDLGLSQGQTNAAIQQLPGAVTLGFTPYARRLDEWIALSRAAGHEVLLQLPMEPFDFPTSDPGPHTLLTSLAPDENLERLQFLLSRFSGYVGAYNRMGDRFTASAESVTPVLQALRDRGLLMLDARTSGTSVVGRVATDLGLPHALNNRVIDQVASRVEIDAKLIDLENIARQEGSAVGMARPYPVTIERLALWASGLAEKGIDLAPLSAVVEIPGEEARR